MATVEQFDSQSLRRETLATVVTIAEQAHVEYDALYPGTVTREEAIAAVFIEAYSMWGNETYNRTVFEDELREIASDVLTHAREQAASDIFALAPREGRQSAYSAAMSSIYGPSEDDSTMED